MKHKIPILDIIKIDESILRKKGSNIAFYTGMLESNIPIRTSFKYFYDKTNHNVLLEGDFIIKHIEILSKPSQELVKGYNAVIFVKSNMKYGAIEDLLTLDKTGNLKNVFEFSNIKPE